MNCSKCQGKVFVDLTFTDNKNYETFCLRCGKRDFVGPDDDRFAIIRAYVRETLVV